jgi:hypothetical protein
MQDASNLKILCAWEVAQALGISQSKFLRTVANDIPHIRKGKFRLYEKSAVDSFIHGRLKTIGDSETKSESTHSGNNWPKLRYTENKGENDH